MDIICFHKITYEWVYDFPTRKRRSETRLPSKRSQNVPLSALRTSTCVCAGQMMLVVKYSTLQKIFWFLKPRGWNFIIIRNSRHVSLQLLSVGWGHFNALKLQAEETTRHTWRAPDKFCVQKSNDMNYNSPRVSRTRSFGPWTLIKSKHDLYAAKLKSDRDLTDSFNN